MTTRHSWEHLSTVARECGAPSGRKNPADGGIASWSIVVEGSTVASGLADHLH